MGITQNTLKTRMIFLAWITPCILILLALLQQGIHLLWVARYDNFILNLAVVFLFSVLIGPLFVLWNFVSLLHGLEQQEQANQQRLDTEHKLAQIVNSSVDAILSTDAQGRIATWNDGAGLFFGYTNEQMVNQPLAILLGNGATQQLETRWLIDAVQQDGYVRRHETTCLGASRQMIHVELTASLLRDEMGKGCGMSLILRDVTNRKKREEEIYRLNNHLNQQATARTREFAEKVEQLARANAELNQLDQTRSEFVSLVSHQIRAPLTNMDGAIQRMQMDCGAINPTCTRMFVIFRQQVERIERLVQDVLNAARIEMGELRLQLEPISIMPIAQQALQQVGTRTTARQFRLADKPGLPLVYADRDGVAEILSNLLDNAVKYSYPASDIFIDIRADQSVVTIGVRDCGPGIAAEDQKHLFSKFYRSDSSDSQTAYGYGLGLYICRQLVEAQNGHIWAENHPDGGAVFSFTLPVWQD